MGIAELAVSSLLIILGLYLTHSLRRQQSLKIAEQRLEAYRPIWELSAVASQSRWSTKDGRGPLTREEAFKLRRDMTSCYYSSGHGMFLTKTTTELYWKVRERLGDYAISDGDEDHAKRCMMDFSVLRQQMRLDIKALSGRPSYWAKLNDGDTELLKSAGIRNPESWGLPWYGRLLHRFQRSRREPDPDWEKV
jgi:hypothetical protein